LPGGCAKLRLASQGVEAQRDPDREGDATKRELNNAAVLLTGLSGGVVVLGFALPTK
jgi:hypothetical protein